MRKFLLLCVNLFVCAFALAQTCEVTPLKGFPSSEKGYEQGVSACYAGCLGDNLVMAGGANFAIRPAAEGGPKCYYQGIYAAHINDGETLEWTKIGELPMPLAYGVALCHDGELLVIGGSNADGMHSSVYCIRIVDGKAMVRKLPSLPIPISDGAGAININKVYVGGGKTSNGENKCVYCLDLTNEKAGWQKVEMFIGQASVQQVALINDGYLEFLGGFTSAPSPFVYDGPSGGALARTEDGRIFVSGGVNHDIFLDAISGRYELVDKKDYMLKEPSWYKFDGRLRQFIPSTREFVTIAENPDLARAGASLVAYKNKYLFSVGGEIKPGVRSPQITRITLK